MNMKKIAAILLVLAMVLGLNVQAFAATGTSDITITGNGTFKAYRILDARSLGVTGGKEVYEYTVPVKYRAALQSATKKTSDADIINYINGLADADVRTFADAVYAQVKDMEAEKVSAEGKISNVPYGYYLFAETAVSSTAEDTISLVMLDTAGKAEVEVATKEGVPQVSKQVLEVNDSTGAESWGTAADYDMGDAVMYQIRGTVSAEFSGYESYDYKFEDTMADGLTLTKDSIRVYVGGTEEKGIYTGGGMDVTGKFAIETDEHHFTAAANLKNLTGVAITGNTKIYVTYTAVLNADAVIGGEGNLNTAVLWFENDPYYAGAVRYPGKTPEVTNVVFTLAAEVNKVDENNAELEGAGFTLYKWQAPAQQGGEGSWNPVGSEITGVTTFVFNGLDAGQYKLVESTVPSGYNKADDVIFEIRAQYADQNADSKKEVSELVVYGEDGEAVISGEGNAFRIDAASGKVSTAVINRAGMVLPSTGGMGTKIFYIAGAVLLIGSLIVIVTRKRVERDK